MNEPTNMSADSAAPLRYREFGQSSLPLLVLIPRPSEPESRWSSMAERLAGAFRVVLVESGLEQTGEKASCVEQAAGRLRALLSTLGVPAVVIAHGDVPTGVSTRLAAADEKAVRGLILIDGVPPCGGGVRLPRQPTLILRGRQSETLSHERAVQAFARLPAGRLVELENCGSTPHADAPDAVYAAVCWFANALPDSTAPLPAT